MRSFLSLPQIDVCLEPDREDEDDISTAPGRANASPSAVSARVILRLADNGTGTSAVAIGKHSADLAPSDARSCARVGKRPKKPVAKKNEWRRLEAVSLLRLEEDRPDGGERLLAEEWA